MRTERGAVQELCARIDSVINPAAAAVTLDHYTSLLFMNANALLLATRALTYHAVSGGDTGHGTITVFRDMLLDLDVKWRQATHLSGPGVEGGAALARAFGCWGRLRNILF